MSIIGAIIGGAIIGALARLFMKGNQNIGMLVTIILGMLGSAITSWLLERYWTSAGSIIHFIISILVAIVLITIYTSITNKSSK